MSEEFPDKPFYKIGEVCQYTDTQPYVLRFWESEFPQLAPEKNRSGQRVYRREDVDLIFRIKKLLYEEEYTIAGARRRLEQGDEAAEGPEPGREALVERRVAAARAARDAAEPTVQADARRRPLFDDEPAATAVQETPGAADVARPAEEVLEALRRDLEDARSALRRSEAATAAAESQRDAMRRRMEKGAARLEEALSRLDEMARNEGP